MFNRFNFVVLIYDVFRLMRVGFMVLVKGKFFDIRNGKMESWDFGKDEVWLKVKRRFDDSYKGVDEY